MCDEVVERIPRVLELAPDQYKTQEMCNKAVQSDPKVLSYVPDQYKTQEMCNEAVQSDRKVLSYVPDQYKTQEMCNEAVEKSPEFLMFVLDWFVTLQEICNEDFDDAFITWRDAYIKRKTQKAKIKEELMSVAWHPDRWWNWCVPEHEKKELEIYFA